MPTPDDITARSILPGDLFKGITKYQEFGDSAIFGIHSRKDLFHQDLLVHVQTTITWFIGQIDVS
jgi:hypothetical protein